MSQHRRPLQQINHGVTRQMASAARISLPVAMLEMPPIRAGKIGAKIATPKKPTVLDLTRKPLHLAAAGFEFCFRNG